MDSRCSESAGHIVYPGLALALILPPTATHASCSHQAFAAARKRVIRLPRAGAAAPSYGRGYRALRLSADRCNARDLDPQPGLRTSCQSASGALESPPAQNLKKPVGLQLPGKERVPREQG